jgi:hypothetical protein
MLKDIEVVTDSKSPISKDKNNRKNFSYILLLEN